MHKNSGIIVVALITVACLLGGGGVAYGISNLAVQLVAIAALALNGEVVGRFARNGTRALVLLTGCSLLLPVLQLVPLPPGVWHGFPGRSLLAEGLGADAQQAWRPLTVNTMRTFGAFAGLIAPFAVIVFGWHSSRAMLHRAVLATVGIGVLSVGLGTFQVLGQNQFGLLYPENEMRGVLFGFFANRNSTAVFLVCCLLFLCSLPRQRSLGPRWLAKLVATVLLVTGVILTQSRTGLVLLALPLAMIMLQAIVQLLEQQAVAPQATGPGMRTTTSRMPLKAAVIVIALAVVGGGAIAALPGSRVETVLSRFDKADEPRPAIWEDARFAVERYWPAGAGMGTFDEVFQIDESLENISPRRAGRAHNDYLELAIEAGPFALLIVLGWAIWALWALWAALARAEQERWEALAGAGVLLAVALQSLLDYPLRNQAMLCVTALAVAILARHQRGPAEPQSLTPGEAA